MRFTASSEECLQRLWLPDKTLHRSDSSTLLQIYVFVQIQSHKMPLCFGFSPTETEIYVYTVIVYHWYDNGANSNAQRKKILPERCSWNKTYASSIWLKTSSRLHFNNQWIHHCEGLCCTCLLIREPSPGLKILFAEIRLLNWSQHDFFLGGGGCGSWKSVKIHAKNSK